MLIDLRLPSRQNLSTVYNGIDSPTGCLSKTHFLKYPYDVSYHYNSRGFRDTEWPDDLTNAIWCLGDSFTVGIGVPISHTWVSILQSKTDMRCINISLDGASNSWIGRRAVQILTEVKPKYMVIHWSFMHRTEHSDATKNDEDRREHFDINSITLKSLITNFVEVLVNVERSKGSTSVVYSHIPSDFYTTLPGEISSTWNTLAGDGWPECPISNEDVHALPDYIKHELKIFNSYYKILELIECVNSPDYQIYQNYFSSKNVIPVFEVLDYARDGFHYDHLTANMFVDKVISLL